MRVDRKKFGFRARRAEFMVAVPHPTAPSGALVAYACPECAHELATRGLTHRVRTEQLAACGVCIGRTIE